MICKDFTVNLLHAGIFTAVNFTIKCFKVYRDIQEKSWTNQAYHACCLCTVCQWQGVTLILFCTPALSCRTRGGRMWRPSPCVCWIFMWLRVCRDTDTAWSSSTTCWKSVSPHKYHCSSTVLMPMLKENT